jgi:hypothetical protein
LIVIPITFNITSTIIKIIGNDSKNKNSSINTPKTIPKITSKSVT